MSALFYVICGIGLGILGTVLFCSINEMIEEKRKKKNKLPDTYKVCSGDNIPDFKEQERYVASVLNRYREAYQEWFDRVKGEHYVKCSTAEDRREFRKIRENFRGLVDFRHNQTDDKGNDLPPLLDGVEINYTILATQYIKVLPRIEEQMMKSDGGFEYDDLVHRSKELFYEVNESYTRFINIEKYNDVSKMTPKNLREIENHIQKSSREYKSKVIEAIKIQPTTVHMSRHEVLCQTENEVGIVQDNARSQLNYLMSKYFPMENYKIVTDAVNKHDHSVTFKNKLK